jgi:hypothetical protein
LGKLGRFEIGSSVKKNYRLYAHDEKCHYRNVFFPVFDDNPLVQGDGRVLF